MDAASRQPDPARKDDARVHLPNASKDRLFDAVVVGRGQAGLAIAKRESASVGGSYPGRVTPGSWVNS